MIFVTGDCHADFRKLNTKYFPDQVALTKNDYVIVCGDFGYWDGSKQNKYEIGLVAQRNFTTLFVDGNHENYVSTEEGFLGLNELPVTEWHGGNIWVEQDFPKILFAEDGDRYEINDHSFFVIGGAYSVDKEYRLTVGAPWFSDEQPDDGIKKRVMDQLKKDDYKEDIILTHTCPMSMRPVDRFMAGIEQAKVDTSTEEFLESVSLITKYNKWYCGHWHVNRKTPQIEFLFEKVAMVA